MHSMICISAVPVIVIDINNMLCHMLIYLLDDSALNENLVGPQGASDYFDLNTKWQSLEVHRMILQPHTQFPVGMWVSNNKPSS